MTAGRKTLIMLAAVSALVSATSPAANALTVDDPGVIGVIKDAVPFGLDETVTYTNNLLAMDPGTTETIGSEVYTTGSTNDYWTSYYSTDSGEVSKYDADGNINYLTGSTTEVASGYEYLIAKYDGPNGGAVVYYLDGSAWTLPETSEPLWMNKKGTAGLGLSGWVAFNTVPLDVPDGGSTVLLLGSALVAIRVLRSKISGN